MSGSYRQDLLTGEWVIISSERRASYSRRSAGDEPPKLRASRCPFCPGHEADTEETIAQLPIDGPWRVRVVGNRYPIVGGDLDPVAEGPAPSLPLHGAHEVIVETPAHGGDLDDLELDHLTDVLRIYRDRARAVSELEHVRSVAIFRNWGRNAGSSQPHPHAQLIGAAVVSEAQRGRDVRAIAHADRAETTLLGHLLEAERNDGARVVHETDAFVVLCPYAPRHSFQTWIAPRSARGTFLETDDASLAALAPVLSDTISRVRRGTDGGAYNLVFRLPLTDTPKQARFWYIDVIPRRRVGRAGFELTTGVNVVKVAPERAAEILRTEE